MVNRFEIKPDDSTDISEIKVSSYNEFVMPGHPHAGIYRGYTPTVGKNGIVELLLELPPFGQAGDADKSLGIKI